MSTLHLKLPVIHLVDPMYCQMYALRRKLFPHNLVGQPITQCTVVCFPSVRRFEEWWQSPPENTFQPTLVVKFRDEIIPGGHRKLYTRYPIGRGANQVPTLIVGKNRSVQAIARLFQRKFGVA